MRLVAAGANEFNRVGYGGTDSNRIARAAGYAPGTFYKHFADKRDVFLAAYEAWVTAEWNTIGAIVRHRISGAARLPHSDAPSSRDPGMPPSAPAW
jgi:AcrR family transcriptional regulator